MGWKHRMGETGVVEGKGWDDRERRRTSLSYPTSRFWCHRQRLSRSTPTQAAATRTQTILALHRHLRCIYLENLTYISLITDCSCLVSKLGGLCLEILIDSLILDIERLMSPNLNTSWFVFNTYRSLPCMEILFVCLVNLSI